MKSRSTHACIPFLAALCLLAAAAASAAGDPVYHSPLDLAANDDKGLIYVAQHTANKVAVFDAAKESVVDEFDLDAAPNGLALSPDGETLFVTLDGPDGTVVALKAGGGREIGSIKVGHTPTGLAVSPDGALLIVCNRFDDDVSVIDTDSMKEICRVPVSREPFAVAIAQDRALIANHLPPGAADGDYTAAVISVLRLDDLREQEEPSVATKIALPNGSTGLRGICVSPCGQHAYATHILARYHLPTTQLERGWMNTNALSIIDVENEDLINTVLLDDVDLGAANPWGVDCSPDGKYVCVAHAGTHQVSVIDRIGLHAELARAEERKNDPNDPLAGVAVPDNLAFLVRVRERYDLVGNGPRGLVFTNGKVWTAEYFTGTLGVIDPDSQLVHRPTSFPLGVEATMTTERRGEMFFNDANLCFQKWQSCSSCHPDSRADALNWDLLNDGFGNPKNTKSMLLSHQTPPVMISGVRGAAEVAVRAGIKYIQFAVRPEEDAEDIDAFLKSLKPVPSPYLVEGKLSESAQRGEKLFDEAGCARCHPKPLFTDLQSYDVGTGSGREDGMAFDTPALVEIWRTAPYLYDGRAVTIEEVLTKFNHDDKHGKTSNLTPEQIKDLADYVLSH